MDSWYHEDDNSLSGRIFESIGAPFCNTSSDDFPELKYNGGLAYLSDSGFSNPMDFNASQIPSHLYKIPVIQMDRRNPFSQDFDQQESQMEFLPSEHSQPSSSSLSLLKTLSMGCQEFTSFHDTTVHTSSVPNLSRTNVTAQTTCTATPEQKTPIQSYIQSWNTEGDDAAITRAIVAVISSSTSSSSASSPSMISQSPSEAQVNKVQASCLSPAFQPYKSALAPKLSSTNKLSGQKMIKKSMSMLENINMVKPEEQEEEMRPTNNHLHHMFSERRRREKLNESFHALRTLLPSSAKKDKASILNNARNYLNTLKAQISELEEKNSRLETHLSAAYMEDSNCSAEKIKVKITKSSEPTTELQQVTLRVTVRVECNIVELVLDFLECLKAMGDINVASVDAYTYSPHRPSYARANFKLQIKACDWNEASLQEAMNKTINGIAMSIQ